MKKMFFILLIFFYPVITLKVYGSESYTNRISAITLNFPYTEVCFKFGSVHTDIHEFGGSTKGGHCYVGDRGFIIEKNRRGHTYEWYLALETCLKMGMRLPRPYEWILTCKNQEKWLVSGMSVYNKWEWASNIAFPITSYGSRFAGVVAFGSENCDHAVYYPVGHEDGYNREIAFRCAL